MSHIHKIGRYELFEEIGAGAFAIVYRGHDTVLKRPVAVKIMHPVFMAEELFVERFQLEAETAANLDHPHIIPILDFGEAEGRLFIVMKLMTGGSLAELLRDKPLSWEMAVTYFAQVADALDFAHGRGVIHRDLKPSNIFIDERDNTILGDFGVGKALENATRALTRTGNMLGTPAYMPPEIWSGQPASPASDQYALACVFYEMVTGQQLFNGPTDPAVMKAHFDPLVLPEQWPPDVPPQISALLRQALAKEPTERFPSLNAMNSQVQALRLDPLAMPYEQLQTAFETQDWDEVVQQGDAILAQDNSYRDVSVLVEEAWGRLTELQVSPWREQAEAAVANEDWDVARGAIQQWLTIQPDRAEANALLKTVENQAATSRHLSPLIEPKPKIKPQTARVTNSWFWGIGALTLLLLLCGGWSLWGNNTFAAIEPTSTLAVVAVVESTYTPVTQSVVTEQSGGSGFGAAVGVGIEPTRDQPTNTPQPPDSLSDDVSMYGDAPYELGENNIITIESGKIVVQSNGSPVMIANRYAEQARLLGAGVMGIEYVEEPLAFTVHCFVGECYVEGSVDGERVLRANEAVNVGASGGPGEVFATRNEEFVSIAAVVPVPTATSEPTATFTPEPTLTIVPTRIAPPPALATAVPTTEPTQIVVDTDGDGFPDNEDNCPTIAGNAEDNPGCPFSVEQTEAMKGGEPAPEPAPPSARPDG